MAKLKDGYLVAFRCDQPDTDGRLEAYRWDGRDLQAAIRTIQYAAAEKVARRLGSRWARFDSIHVEQIGHLTVAGPLAVAFAIALGLSPKWYLHGDENGLNRQRETGNPFFGDALCGTVYLTGARRGSYLYQPLTLKEVRHVERATNDKVEFIDIEFDIHVAA